MSARLLRYVLVLNALGCLVAALVLFGFPSAIPALIGIKIQPDQYMICRLVGASELAIAAACSIAIRRPSRQSYDLCIVVLVVLHAGSITAVAAEIVDHSNAVVVANIVVRAVIIALLLALVRSRPTAQ